MTWEEKIFYERLDAKNEGKIKTWLKLAVRVSSVEEFLEKSGLR